MKKLTKLEVIKLLKSKQCSYKELAIITGYHEKSLVRLNKEIKRGIERINHGNKNRKPHNYITEEVKQEIINTFKEKVFKSYKEYYLYLQSKNICYSYSFIRQLLVKNKCTKKEDLKIIKRKLIADNIIQYKNIRYRIINGNIKHHTEVELYYYNDNAYIVYNNRVFELEIIKQIKSRTGLSKYY